MVTSSTDSYMSPKIPHKPGKCNKFDGEMVCGHDLLIKYKTSHTVKNPERKFYYCRVHQWNDCGVWQWVDPELSPYYKICFNKMKQERDKEAELLDINELRKQIESLMIKATELKEQLAIAIESVHELQKLNASMEHKMKKVQWKNRMFLIFLVLLAVWASLVK